MAFEAYNKHSITSLEYSNNNSNMIKSIYKKSPEHRAKSKTVTIKPNPSFIPLKNHLNSDMESVIINSKNPIPIKEQKEIVVNNYSGIWANKTETDNWIGSMPLEKYRINDDPNPSVIKKKPTEKLVYKQDIKVKYLNPPKLPKPGDIIVNVEPDRQIPPAPPVIIRQQRAPIPDPEPIIFRESPPKVPPPIETKVINIPGKVIPPPARKLIVEKLPQIPPKPQPIIIERWLAYQQQKRKVVLNKPASVPIISDPKNLIIDWRSPDVEIVPRIKTRGIYNTDPNEYKRKYAREIADRLPDFTREIVPPKGLKLAADHQVTQLPELEGDLEALKMVDLDQVGLSEYKQYLKNKFTQNDQQSYYADDIAKNLFRSIDKQNIGLVKIEDAFNVLYGLNVCFGKKLTENSLRDLLLSLDNDRDNHLNLNEFLSVYVECVY